MIKVEVAELGPIKKGSLSINNLMVFCGENNEGKTYASYLLHGLFKIKFRSEFNYFNFSDLLQKGDTVFKLNRIIDDYALVLSK